MTSRLTMRFPFLPQLTVTVIAQYDNLNPVTGGRINVTAKFIALFMVLAMAAHLIRPFGLPGLRKRRDFWKIGVIAFATTMLVVLIRA